MTIDVTTQSFIFFTSHLSFLVLTKAAELEVNSMLNKLKNFVYVSTITVMNYSAAIADDFAASFYGSLRVQAQHVSVDQAADNKNNSYYSLEDAYSRIGSKINYSPGDTQFSAQLEASINAPKLRFEDPTFFDHSAIRIAKVAASGQWGTAWAGKGWLPYYNNIAYSVDRFSSLYSGYATYAYFREYAAVYSTPELNGFIGTAAAIKRTDGGPRGNQFTLSYTVGGLTLAAAVENMEDHYSDTQGGAISYTTGPWYAAVKYEDNDDNGNISNLYVQYAHDKLTYKGMIAGGDQYSGDTYQAGIDYQYNEPLKLFAEYYYEEKNYAILQKDTRSASDYLGAGGFGAEQNGEAFVVGIRYDF